MNFFDSFKSLLNNFEHTDSIEYDLIDLSQLKVELKKREDSYMSQLEELELREKLIFEREQNLNLREKQVVDALNSRETLLKEKEAELEKKIKESETMAALHIAKYREATERYINERKLWEETIKTKNTPSEDYEDVFREIVESFKKLRGTMDETKDAIVEARDTVRNGFYEGILKLCTLYREMCFTKEPRLKELADNLGVILMSEFEVNPIEPMTGDEFCGELHERIDTTKRGEIISCCRVRGWNFKGKTLLRAVVETMEGVINNE